LFFKDLPALTGIPKGSIEFNFPFPHQLYGIGLNSKNSHLRQIYQINEICSRVLEYPQYSSALAIKGRSSNWMQSEPTNGAIVGVGGTVVGVATKRRESDERKKTRFCCPQQLVIWTCPVPLEEQAAETTWYLLSILDVLYCQNKD
jgi:hypothetical protein